MKYSISNSFLILAALAFLVLAALAQDMPPHRSAITPPPEPFDMPFLHRMPTNMVMMHVPAGKKAEMFQIGNMQLEDLLDRVKTNRYNLFLVQLSDVGPAPLRAALISPEDELVLSNHHRAMPQQP